MEFGRNWMKHHREQWGDSLIKDLCLPASHDAGAYRIQWSTWLGGDGQVVTQTKTILEQLDLGVRRFDIRPKLIPDAKKPWSCGHGTDTGLGFLGWQGGIGVTIKDVVDDINTFTAGKEELIFLDMREVQKIEQGITMDFEDSKSTGYVKKSVSDSEWMSLLDQLKGIQCLYAEDQSLYSQKSFQDHRLKDFFDGHKSAVVVLVDGYHSPQHLFDRKLWPAGIVGQPNVPYLHLNTLENHEIDPSTLCLMQDTPDAIISTFSMGQINSIKSLAKKHQERMFPILLQRTLQEFSDSTESKKVEMLEMDFIENLDLLTFCLAITERRFNASRNNYDIVIYYCAKPITHQAVKNKMRDAISVGKSFKVNDIEALDVNPAPEMSKCCAVFYYHNGLYKGRYGRQDDHLHFEEDVLRIAIFAQEIQNHRAYYNVWKAVRAQETFKFDVEKLGLEIGLLYQIDPMTAEFREKYGEKIQKITGQSELNFQVKPHWASMMGSPWYGPM